IKTHVAEIGAALLLPPPGVDTRGTILAWHGYLSYGVYLVPGLERLAERGWACLSADLPGHGFSTGEPGSIADFSDYARVTDAVLAWANGQTTYRNWS
ncbi:MAG: alpha/beta hydrolase, partial [Rectinemataceae bacterium]